MRTLSMPSPHSTHRYHAGGRGRAICNWNLEHRPSKGLENMTLEAIKYKKGHLEVLDQLLLPQATCYITVENVNDGWKVINKMQVRGAPAIAIVACLSLAVELHKKQFDSNDSLHLEVKQKLAYLVSARPTAVNIKKAADELIAMLDLLVNDDSVHPTDLKNKIISHIEDMLDQDVQTNKDIGDHGAAKLLTDCLQVSRLKVLTHCNTGSLATAGYGTALGVIRSLHKRGKLERAFCTETRPYNQGARLTAYELVVEKIPATMVVDSAVAALMRTQNISAVVVGADCVTANGDTANKIGTYQIAVVASKHGVPFYVAAPLTTIDLSKKSGKDIVIEDRPAVEMTHVGGLRIAADGIECWNPAFDVTPAELIQGIITEKGVFTPAELESGVKKFLK